MKIKVKVVALLLQPPQPLVYWGNLLWMKLMPDPHHSSAQKSRNLTNTLNFEFADRPGVGKV
jgi:hypothetical protein